MKQKLSKIKDKIIKLAKDLDQNHIIEKRSALLKEWHKKDPEKINKFLINLESLIFALSTLEMAIKQETKFKTNKNQPEINNINEIPTEPESLPQVEKPFRQTKTEQLQCLNVKKPKNSPVKDEQAILKGREDTLYKDVFRLLELGDVNGALISLERLMIIAPESDKIKEFLKVNRNKIIELYEERFGTFTRIPKLIDNENKISLEHFSNSKMESILQLIDSHTPMIDLTENSDYNLIEVCSTINQLIRLGYLELL